MTRESVTSIKTLLHHRLFLPYALSLAFIALNTLLIANEFYWLALLPFAIVLVLFYIFSLDKVILLITFLTPLSINIANYDIGIGISLPTEPLMAGVLLIYIINIFRGNTLDRKLYTHPVSIVIMVMLAWMLITSITSEFPLVSFKYLLARLWFLVPFFFLAVPLFRKRKNIIWFLWLYGISFAGVVIYSGLRLYLYDFDQQAAHWVMDPFYNDHTAYGAVLALYLPVFACLTFSSRFKGNVLLAYVAITLIISTGLILSMSRAAWVSAIAALFVFALIRFKVKSFWMAIAGVIAILLLFAYQDNILNRLERNRQESSANLREHVQSISNISSDASNLERINRWKAAYRMFQDRPLTGWGPGTYQFVYAPYQRSHEKTIISTNAGNLGNVHSEYLGPLSEWGAPGLIIILSLIGTIIFTALRVLKRTTNQDTHLLTLAFFLGLVTYFVHGLLNNFLDTDKASVPFWGFTAVIVALDLYYLPQEKALKSE